MATDKERIAKLESQNEALIDKMDDLKSSILDRINEVFSSIHNTNASIRSDLNTYSTLTMEQKWKTESLEIAVKDIGTRIKEHDLIIDRIKLLSKLGWLLTTTGTLTTLVNIYIFIKNGI